MTGSEFEIRSRCRMSLSRPIAGRVGQGQQLGPLDTQLFAIPRR
jgi:hypothetical protein